MFFAPHMEKEPHCYNELDISPYNVMYNSGIYNKNLNQTGAVNTEFACESSDVTHQVVTDRSAHEWTASMTFSWSLLNCPVGCPLPNYCGHTQPNQIYRVNFYRVNELVETSKCSSSTCEYMAWSPTMANPPAFHIPTKFGYAVLV